MPSQKNVSSVEPFPLAVNFQINSINGMYLIWENDKIETKDIEIFFKNGTPYIIKALLIFKNSNEWFHFLNFMTKHCHQVK